MVRRTVVSNDNSNDSSNNMAEDVADVTTVLLQVPQPPQVTQQ